MFELVVNKLMLAKANATEKVTVSKNFRAEYNYI